MRSAIPGCATDDVREALRRQLECSRDLGFLGPGPVEAHIVHAAGFADAFSVCFPGSAPNRALDLGCGGGPPGLVLAALHWPHSEWIFIEAAGRRCSFLRDAARALALTNVTVHQGRAEDIGRDPRLRGRCDLVVARSFGPPGVTAECAAPFLAPGGLAVVSEPPGGRPERWDAGALRQLGLRHVLSSASPHAFGVLCAAAPCPDRFPRRSGVPAKRPLF